MNIKILYEDKHIIIIEKPAGMPSQDDKTGDASALSFVRGHTKNAVTGVFHRLDRPVGGALLFAKTALANKNLAKSSFCMEKIYYAVCSGAPKEVSLLLEDYLYKDGKTNTSFVTDKSKSGAKLARLKLKKIKSVNISELGEDALKNNKNIDINMLSLLEVTLLSGRHHQIRVQLSHAGIPIAGDRKYGGISLNALDFPALWAAGLKFSHPVTKKPVCVFSAPCGILFNLFADALMEA